MRNLLTHAVCLQTSREMTKKKKKNTDWPLGLSLMIFQIKVSIVCQEKKSEFKDQGQLAVRQEEEELQCVGQITGTWMSQASRHRKAVYVLRNHLPWMAPD